MTQGSRKLTRIDRLFLIAFVPVISFWAVCAYVRFTSDKDPPWTEFALPLVLGLLGARVLVAPGSPENRQVSRGAGILLLGCSVIILLLSIYDALGAN
jgi:hypothetical protein